MKYTKSRNCPLCGSEKKIKLWDKVKDIYVKCKDCSVVYQNNILSIEQQKELYSNQNYYIKHEIEPSNYGFHNYNEESTEKIFNEYFKLIEINNQTDGKTILDVGCATGTLLKIAQNKGWQAVGVEISEWSSNIARENGLNIYQKTVRECAFDSNTFDVITLYHVVEHFIEPNEEIKELYRILKPNGILIIETPNVESLTSKYLYKARYPIFQPNVHTVLFSKKTITILLNKNGFHISKIKTMPLTRTYNIFIRLYFRRLIKYILSLINYRLGPINIKKYFQKPDCTKLPQLTVADVMFLIAKK